MRGVGVGDELRDDGRFGDDVAVVGKTGDEAALLGCILLDYIQAVLWSTSSCRWGGGVPYGVDLEIPGLSRLLDVNDDFLVVKAGFLQGNMCAVCPRAAVVGVEDDLWRCHCCGMIPSLVMMVGGKKLNRT